MDTCVSTATYHPNGSLAGLTYGNSLIHSQTLNSRGLPQRIRDRNQRIDYIHLGGKLVPALSVPALLLMLVLMLLPAGLLARGTR